MAQWTDKNTKAGAPKYVVDASTGNTGTDEFGNTVFNRIKAADQENPLGPGWVRVVKGQGKIEGIEIVNGGTGYDAADTINLGGDSLAIEVDDEGAIAAVDFTPTGDVVDEIPEADIQTATGTGAEVRVVTSGRLGRFQGETLIAMRTRG